VTNYDAASLLKQYLQELPIPVLTFEYMHLFPLVCKMNCKVGKKLEALNLLILMLPCAHSHTLKLLLIYLSQVVQNELHNQMNLESVAKIMTPTFFGSSSDRGMGKNGARSLGSIDDEMRSNQEQQEVMQLLINYHEQLWIVPDFLLSEIRFKDQHHGPADKQKSLPVLKSLFRRANANRRESSDLVDGHHHHHHHHHHHTHPSAVNHLPSVVLSPSASSFVPRKVEIKLGHNTSVEVDTQLHPTVGDIMNYVQHSTMGSHSKPPTSSPPTQVLHGSPVNSKGDSSQSLQGSPGSIGSNYKLSSSYSQEGWVKAIDGDVSKKLCLFEVGGNITKRCLSDEKALFSNLYELNPSASWVVEFR
ncbi:rho GTPase-activating protein 18-like, partial [Convolutriloba macropyga]|uniref:rho GTPase-activating protein 18-like n=1 Tax=Convolutriloba macropyga TaxID=536237 RepID=UPI003F51F6E1